MRLITQINSLEEVFFTAYSYLCRSKQCIVTEYKDKD